MDRWPGTKGGRRRIQRLGEILAVATPLAALLAVAPAATAQVPAMINFQGRLLASDGTPEAGILSVGFALWDVESGGTPLWSETQTIAFSDGFYSVMLGSVAPLPLSVLADPIYVSVTVAGTELLPRMRVASVAFALRSGVAEALVVTATGSGSGLDADSVDGLDATDLATAGHTHAPGDADTLDGLDSAAFAPTGHSHAPADATTLDGLDSTAFAASGHGHSHGSLSGIGAADHHAPFTSAGVGAYLSASAGRRMPVTLVAGVVTYTAPDGTASMLNIGAGATAVSNGYVSYAPGGAGDATLYFNIDAAPTIACTLLHNEDDNAVPGYYFGTDAGNGYNAIWGNTTTGTFILRRAGVATMVMPNNAGLQIFCP